MKGRCYRPKHKWYHRYGGRGIKVCDRWLNSPENFVADMGKRPSPAHKLERKDNDGDYCPENCVWATQEHQNNNRGEYNRILEFNGETLTLSQWARRVGLRTGTISERLRHGWTISDALTRPLQSRRRRIHLGSS